MALGGFEKRSLSISLCCVLVAVYRILLPRRILFIETGEHSSLGFTKISSVPPLTLSVISNI